MGSQKRSGLILAITTLSLATFGCMGTGVMGSGSDASPTPGQTATPTPGTSATPTPSGTPAVTCSFIFANNGTATGTLDIYEVDIDSSLWATGTIQLDGKKAGALYLLGANQNSGTFSTAGVATSGSISITVSGTTAGSQASFTDSASLTFFDGTGALKGTASALGAQSATGGAGSFSGSLSNLSGGTPTPGTGTVTVNISGTGNKTFGTLASVAGCQ